MEIDINQIKKVHFIGIGGIGISAIARLMITLGKKVSGSDSSSSPITQELEKIGAEIFIGQKSENVPKDADLVIYTIAIIDQNPELQTSRTNGIKTITYPEMLSVISKNMYTIAISGTHGKTTTTAMIAKIFIDQEIDPTVIVGSILKDHNSNLIVGKSKYFIVEACEYKRSFLNLHPTILVITNIDLDHLDYYKDLEDIQSAFRELCARIPKNGAVICDTQNKNVLPVIKNLNCKVLDYRQYLKTEMVLKSPGEHNRENAAACLAVTDFLKLNEGKAEYSLSQFSGTWRRFDLKGVTSSGTIIYDDYAHHPKEITSTLSGLKEKYPNLNRVVFFQPHLYSRTKEHLDEFANSYRDVDEVYILPIYAAREKFDPEISSEILVDKISQTNKKVSFVKNFDDALSIIKKYDKNSVIMNVGAGDIYKLSELAVLL